MGLRGIGAKPKQTSKSKHRGGGKRHPWTAPGLSRAERVIRFVESLPCTSGPFAGTKLKLRPWQRKFIQSVYRTEKGKRLVRTAVLSMGRKNGKTQLAAALALCALSGPESEERGEVFSCANDRFQAGRIFSEMVAIITRVPWLDARINIIRFRKELEDIPTGSIYAALSADVATKQGLSPSFVVYDELGSATSRELFDALDTSQGGRQQPLLIVISTQAAVDAAPLSTLIDYGLRVQRQEITDPSFHLTLYTAPIDADPWSAATWKLANPALDDFRSLADVQRLALQAQRMPSAEGSFRQFILNQRVEGTPQFLTMAAWKSCGGAAELQPGRPCFAGLDLGATKDLTALILVLKNADGSFDVASYCWLPGETLTEAEDRDRMPYRQWADAGQLLIFPGRTTDPAVVALKVAELHGRYRIQSLAFDRWRVEDVRRELDAIGCAVELTPWGQGFRDMAPAIDELERLVEQGKLRHGMHPVLGMAAANARIELDAAGNRKLSKRRATGRIDPLQSLAMAIGVATRHQAQPEWTPLLELI
jgi:phage terminase large subunit-like protein